MGSEPAGIVALPALGQQERQRMGAKVGRYVAEAQLGRRWRARAPPGGRNRAGREIAGPPPGDPQLDLRRQRERKGDEGIDRIVAGVYSAQKLGMPGGPS